MCSYGSPVFRYQPQILTHDITKCEETRHTGQERTLLSKLTKIYIDSDASLGLQATKCYCNIGFMTHYEVRPFGQLFCQLFETFSTLLRLQDCKIKRRRHTSIPRFGFEPKIPELQLSVSSLTPRGHCERCYHYNAFIIYTQSTSQTTSSIT